MRRQKAINLSKIPLFYDEANENSEAAGKRDWTQEQKDKKFENYDDSI